MDCGLLGEHLSHSYSPLIHRELGDYSYQLFALAPHEIEAFLRLGQFRGLNVTIPYKKAVMPYCKELSPTARAMGCVNTLLRMEDGSLYGDNTDAVGFARLLDSLESFGKGQKALILGTGGAAGTAKAVIESRGGEAVLISRRGKNHYANLYDHEDATLLVNATPVGMYPHNGECLVELSRLPRLRGVLDLIYNPCRTKLLMEAEKRQIPCSNGLPMLVYQAHRAAELFTGHSIPEERCERILCKLSREMENLILIGMPGSGKTRVGRLLAQRLGRPFADADRELEERIGDIPSFLLRWGEEAFRLEETAVLRDLGRRSGWVIATGGGAVTREENYPLLHQNGRIIRLERQLASLATEGRPLSRGRSLEELFAQRDPLYRAFADLTVENNSTVESTVEKIMERIR